MRVEKDGLGYRAAILSDGVALSVDRLTESRGELYGELTVEQAPEGHLMCSRLSLSLQQSRNGAAGYLSRRSHGVDWAGLLEAFCLEVLRREREGVAPVKLGQRPPRESVDFVLAPILPIGKATILYGEEGTGKSTLAAAIAVAVASGTSTFSHWSVPAPRPVLVLDWEADSDDWNDLVCAVAGGIGIEAPDAIWHQSMAGPLTMDVHRLARLIAEHGAGLVIVDSVGLASPSSRDGADAAEGALRLFSALRVLGTTSLLLDHVAKAAENGSGSRPYGSVYKAALARATYELRASEESDPEGDRHLAMFHRKANTTARQAPVGIRVSRSAGEVLLTWEPVMLADDRIAKGASLVDRIRDSLGRGSLSVDEIATLTESSPAVVRKVLSRHDGLFVAVTKPGEKAKSWGLRASVTPVTRHVTHGSVTNPPLGGGIVTHPSKAGSFDALSRIVEGKA